MFGNVDWVHGRFLQYTMFKVIVGEIEPASSVLRTLIDTKEHIYAIKLVIA